MIDIRGLNKVEVFRSLYRRSKVQGMGYFAFSASGSKNELDFEEAEQIYNSHKGRFDYVNGRVMKVDLTKDSFNEFGYDRDNGENAAQTAIDSLRNGLTLGNVDTSPKEPWQEALYGLGRSHAQNGQLNESEVKKFNDVASDNCKISLGSIKKN